MKKCYCIKKDKLLTDVDFENCHDCGVSLSWSTNICETCLL
jgi:predicted amidophosphoribosyltransferase